MLTVVNVLEGKLAEAYKKKGKYKMKNNDNFWFITLIALFVIAENTGWNIFMRIAVATNAVIVLAFAIKRFIGIKNNA